MYDPATRPNSKYLMEAKVEHDRKNAIVKMDAAVKSECCLRFPSAFPGMVWVVISSNYNYQLVDFNKFCGGEEAIVDRVKTLYIPASEETARTLIEYFHAQPSLAVMLLVPHLNPDLTGRLLAEKIRDSVYSEATLAMHIPGLKKTLFPFQKSGILQMSQRSGRALLADGMGLGKTIQALGFWRFNRLGKTLIVCPKSLMLNWRNEILQGLADIAPEQIFLFSEAQGKVPADRLFYIINYDILEKWQASLGEAGCELLILDEAHYIKNSHARRTKSVFAMAEKIPHVIALTGTPILNRAIEVWNLLHLLDPATFGSKSGFVKRFTNIDEKTLPDTEAAGFESRVKKAGDDSFRSFRDPDELGRILRATVMIRRTKQEVLAELPPKTREMVILPCETSQWNAYIQTEQEFNQYLKEKGMTIGGFLQKAIYERGMGESTLPLLTKLRQQAVQAKLDAAIEWIENFLESGEKLIVFAYHRDPIHLLQEHFGSVAVSFTGEDSVEDRDAVVKSFQNNPEVKLIIISIKAGGTGITLTAASNVAFLETDWSPGNNEQAEDRAHRIGQNAESVNVYYLVGENTIDVPIYNLVRTKAEMLDKVHQINDASQGATIESICDGLNAHLNNLGLKVEFDPDFLVESVRLRHGGWYSTADAEEYARARGSRILRSNLLDDIRLGRLVKDVDVRWVPQLGGRSGSWQIREEALERRIAERSKGRGRPRKEQ